MSRAFDETFSKIEIPEKVPVFPLSNALLFPGMELPLYIFEPRYRRMLADCTRGRKFLAISLLKPGWQQKEEPIPSYDVVGVGYIRAVFDNPDGTSHILLKGVARARIERYAQREPYRIARITPLADRVEDEAEFKRLSAGLKKILLQKMRFFSEAPQKAMKHPREFENPFILSYLACYLSNASPYRKQDLLETSGCNSRMKHLIDLLHEEIYPSGTQN